MRVEHLEEFVHLSRSLNFTQTANRFFVAQPALSRHISALEHELGVQLFEREGGRVRLTREGRQFAEGAKGVIEAYREAVEKLEACKEGVSESLSVGYLLGAAGPFIPQIQEAFGAMHPDVEVRYFSYEFNEIVDALVSGKIDIAIARMTGDSYAGLFDARLLYTDRFYAVLPEGHRLASFAEIEPSDLRGEDIVVPSHQFWQENAEGIRSYLQPVLGEVRVRSMLQDINSLPLLIETQGCIGISMGHLRSYYRQNLVFVPLRDCFLEFPVGVAWRRSVEGPVLLDYVDAVEDAMSGAF